MARISDLIRDSKLETYFLPDCRVETVHKYQESDPTAGQRLVTRLEHWQRQKKVGSGGYGCVWLETRIKGGPGATAQDGAVRAVKQIDTDQRHGSIDYNRELEAIAKFSHPRYERCFVKSFGWYEAPGQLFIAMEYLEIGDLFVYLQKIPSVPETEAKEIAYQILEGLTMMHENGFAHRDLKPNNILIKSHPPDKWWIKLADFGIAKRIEEHHEKPTTITGTPRYIAPEIWGLVERGSPYAADIWALGEILFEMFTKKLAFPTLPSLSSYKSEKDFPVTMLINAGISQPGVDFVLSLMSPYPNDRRTATSAMSSAWIQSLLPHPPEPTKATEDEPQIPYLVTMMTEEFASWTTKLSSEPPEGGFHDMSSSTTMVDPVNPAHGKAEMTQKEKAHPSLGTTVPVVTQGQGQVETLEPRPTEFESQHQTGVSLYRQKQYKKAETILQQALQGRKKVLGDDHKETLRSAHWLGLSLFRQKRYNEAIRISRQTLRGREKVLGHNDEETLRSAHWLGHSLYNNGQYKEAETMFRQTLQGREQVLGPDSKETLYSAHYLALSLHRQKKYTESITMFRRALQGRERVLDYDHEETLNSAYGVGLSLYRQKRYTEAESTFRRVLRGREKTLGHDHEETVAARKYMDAARTRASV